jgi:hypothetical protein
MNYLVGTFHKTGSVWMMQLVHEFSQLTARNFVTVAQREITENDTDDPEGYVLFDYQSIFNDPLGLTVEDRGFVVIRHPKDQIISATRYHERSSEYWLHQPLELYGGKTYQEMINSLETWEKKVVFEMRNASRYNSNSMINFNDPRFIKIKYEDLVSGYPNPESINLIAEHFEFSEFETECFVEAYIKTHMNNNSNEHILDGSINQWQSLWTETLDNGYNRVYGDIEHQLGYQ